MRKTIVAFLLITLFAVTSAEDVRVRLFAGTGKIEKVVVSGEPLCFQLKTPTPQKLPQLVPSFELTATKEGILVKSEDTIVEVFTAIDFWSSSESTPVTTVTANGNTRRFRGRITVSALPQNGGLLLVNTLPQEEYLYGVVPGEVPASWSFECLKAQAILARTYSLNNSSPTKAYDLVDSTSSQVYLGFDHEYPSTNRAVDETQGLVIGYNGRMVNTVYYFSSCGGQTENCGEVWYQNVPYLVSVSCGCGAAVDLSTEEAVQNYFETPLDFACSRSSTSRWQEQYGPEELEKLAGNFAKGAKFIDLIATKRSTGGAVLSVVVKTDQGDFPVNGELNIRRQLGVNRSLRSSFFAMEKEICQDEVVGLTLKGGGWGHRIGVCQWGMEGMAREGKSCQEILKHYLPGTELICLSK